MSTPATLSLMKLYMPAARLKFFTASFAPSSSSICDAAICDINAAQFQRTHKCSKSPEHMAIFPLLDKRYSRHIFWFKNVPGWKSRPGSKRVFPCKSNSAVFDRKGNLALNFDKLIVIFSQNKEGRLSLVERFYTGSSAELVELRGHLVGGLGAKLGKVIFEEGSDSILRDRRILSVRNQK